MHNNFTIALNLLSTQNQEKLTEYTLFHPSLLTEAAFQQLDQRIQEHPAEANLKTLKAFLHEFKTTILQGFQPHAANQFADVIYAAKQALDAYQQNSDYDALQNAVAYWAQLLICVDEYPVSDDTRLTILNDSLQALMDYYWATGEISALEYAHSNIERLQQFAEAPDQAMLVNNLAIIFAEYYRFYNDPAYLEKSLDFYRQTLALTPEGTDDYALSLSNYGMALQEYFECTGDVQVLKDSVEYSEQAVAVALTATTLPQYAARLGSLGSGYFMLYQQSSDLAHLQTAIAHYQTAADKTELASTAYPRRLNNLGNALRRLYAASGDLQQLEISIQVCQQAVDCSQAGGIERAGYFNNLAAAHFEWYVHTGELLELHRAIQDFQQAVDLSQNPSPEYASRLNNLGGALRERYTRTEQLPDLEQAIALFEQALSLLAENAPDYSHVQSNLGVAWRNYYQKTQQHTLLDKAIQALEQALRASHADKLDHADCLNNLGTVWQDRYKVSHKPEDLQQAMRYCEQAVQSLEPSAPEYGVYLNSLGTVYFNQYQRTQRREDFQRTLQTLRQATEYALKTGGGDSLACVQNWMQLVFEAQRWRDCVEVFALARPLLQHLFSSQTTRGDKESWLKDMRGITGKAAYALVQLGETQQAVAALEQGQARLLSENLALERADLSALENTPRAELSTAYQTSLQQWQWALQNQPLKARRAQLDEIVAQIRQVPGYADFLKPSGWNDVAAALADTPLLYLMTTEQGGLALLLKHTAAEPEIAAITLPDFTEDVLQALLQRYLTAYQAWQQADDAQAALNTWRDVLDETTRQLWALVFAPLQEKLPEQFALIPTGLLNLLPLHAAWRPDTQHTNGRRYALDNWQMRYAPNARALKEARRLQRRLPALNQDCALLAIDEPDNHPHLSPLPNSRYEVQAACAAFSRQRILAGNEAGRADVLNALADKHVLHFSCHGRSDLQNPLRSALWMANGEALNLQDFLNTRLHAQLAVLSACETGLPGTRLPNEAVSLAAGLLQAGVASVVSSLWSVAEISTFLLMLRFYRNLAEASPAEALRRAQQWLRDSSNREILAEVREQVEAGRLDEDAYKQVRLAIGFKAMDERSFAPLFYWAAFGVVGV